MKILSYAGFVVCLTGAVLAGENANSRAASASDYLRVIRANNLKALQEMSRRGVTEARDALDWTPLHYAALYGSTEAVRIVLEAGGDPNARNRSQVTPLMFGAYSFEKTRLLVEKGGDVNAKAMTGRRRFGWRRARRGTSERFATFWRKARTPKRFARQRRLSHPGGGARRRWCDPVAPRKRSGPAPRDEGRRYGADRIV